MAADSDVWVVEGPEGVIGIADNLTIAERVLRATYFEDTGYDEDQMADRLTIDLKFMQWVLFVDRRPNWSYTATRAPKL